MYSGPPTHWLIRFVLLGVIASTLVQRIVDAQANADPARLQQDGIAQINQWLDHVRATGDATADINLLHEAQDELKSSFDLFTSRGDSANAAWSLIKIADIQRYENQWPQSILLYQGAVKLAVPAKRVDYQTKALSGMASAELSLGKTDEAAGHAGEAVRLGANCGNKDFYFNALDIASDIEGKRGNVAAASADLDRALVMSGEIGDKYLLYLGYNSRADIYFQNAATYNCRLSYDVCFQSLELARGDYLKAQIVAREAGYKYFDIVSADFLQQVDLLKSRIQISQKVDNNLAAKAFSPKLPKDVLANEDFSVGGMSPAEVAALEAVVKGVHEWMNRMQQHGLAASDLDPSDLSIQATLAQMKGDTTGALSLYQQAVKLLEQDRIQLHDEQSRSALMDSNFYYRPAMILLEQKRYAEAFALFEESRCRTMADMLSSRPISLGTPAERTLFSDLQTQKTVIAARQEKLFDLTSSADRDQSAQKIVQLESEIAGLQKTYEALETRIAKEAPRLRHLTSSEPVTLEQVQRDAAQGGYDVLYYFIFEPNVIVWQISGSGVHVKKVFLPHAQLALKTAALRKSMDTPDAAFDEEISRQLYLYLIQPVAEYVKSDHLLIIPDEEMTSIPFQTLEDPSDGKYLGERFAISYAPSTTVLTTLEPKPNLKSGKLLAVADPAMAAASEEVKSIGALYAGREKIVAQASVSKADVKAWVGGYNLVHLSVHGAFNASDPLLSYLQFTAAPPDDGRLTAAEMFGLPLEKNSLVVLSACETGQTKTTNGGEVLGMVRSLLYAGAGDLVLSSWKVNATSTKLWMETFYREGQTKTPAEAARLALVAVKSRPEYSHPFYWAPFLMTGK